MRNTLFDHFRKTGKGSEKKSRQKFFARLRGWSIPLKKKSRLHGYSLHKIKNRGAIPLKNLGRTAIAREKKRGWLQISKSRQLGDDSRKIK